MSMGLLTVHLPTVFLKSTFCVFFEKSTHFHQKKIKKYTKNVQIYVFPQKQV